MNYKLLTLFRWLVGLLFIFSGLIKANDPLGLSYKMQEFFEAWGWSSFHDYTLAMSVIMNLLEVVAGVALIVGWQMKRVIWLLLLLIVFFTFLTSYVLFSGKIHACGCFGDCVPLTPIQTFTKDIVLLLMILVLLFNAGKMKPYFSTGKSLSIIVASFAAVAFLQWYVQKYLPILDCLPYAKGKNIIEGMKPSSNATPAITKMVFIYKKDGKQLEFQDSVPTHVTEDSTYEYVDRKDKVVKEGTGQPKILDFSFTTLGTADSTGEISGGTDTTLAILNQPNKYVLLFAKDFSTLDKWKKDFEKIKIDLKQKNIPLFLVTASSVEDQSFGNIIILKADAVMMKTAARVNPTYFLMQQANIICKYSYADGGKLLKQINSKL
jgi:uncharacterized membrane protein YphA (DoxX/SURF4 family)